MFRFIGWLAQRTAGLSNIRGMQSIGSLIARRQTAATAGLSGAVRHFLTLSLLTSLTATAYANNSSPLNKNELLKASQLAQTAMVQQRVLAAAARAEVISVTALAAGKSGGSGARKAIVKIYDYDRNRLLTSSVNLDNDRVSRAVVNTRMQPPLASSEGRKAIKIALADTQIMNTLTRVYERITGNPLTDIDNQITLTPRNFHGSEVRNDDGPDIGDCQRHRCVQLSVVTSNSVQINVVPVINLSNDSVVTLLRAGPSENLARRMNKNARDRRQARANRKALDRSEQRKAERNP